MRARASVSLRAATECAIRRLNSRPSVLRQTAVQKTTIRRRTSEPSSALPVRGEGSALAAHVPGCLFGRQDEQREAGQRLRDRDPSRYSRAPTLLIHRGEVDDAGRHVLDPRIDEKTRVVLNGLRLNASPTEQDAGQGLSDPV